jgi:hypothetical protein
MTSGILLLVIHTENKNGADYTKICGRGKKATTNFQNYVCRNHYKAKVLTEASLNITAKD